MATSSRVQSEQSRPYQGYPFVNPVVIDVPTIDAATAAKWSNLPRKPISTPAQTNNSKPPTNDDNQSIYVDVPNEDDSGAQTENSNINESTEKKDVPVVYIELPEEENERVTTATNQGDRGQENPAFVEETIFFDPFENRQIDLNKAREPPRGDEVPEDGPAAGSSASVNPAATSPEPGPSTRPNRPAPPTTLNLSGLQGGSSSTTPSITGFMSKESQVYGCSGSSGDGFTLTPLDVTDYPEPPPAYTEVATNNGRPPGQANHTIPPRTVVVLPEPSPTLGLPSADRKYVQCQNCRMRVHTVVVKENGPLTHIIAIITIVLCLLPITVMVYCTDFFKYRMHFCPNCNHRVGYEIPVLCQSMVFN